MISCVSMQAIEYGFQMMYKILYHLNATQAIKRSGRNKSGFYEAKYGFVS